MLNNISLQGTIERDPEYRVVRENVPLTTFIVACARDNKSNVADFIPCVAKFELASIAKELHKGDRVTLVGSLQSSVWTDRHGARRKSVEIQIEKLYPALCHNKNREA